MIEVKLRVKFEEILLNVFVIILEFLGMGKMEIIFGEVI